MPLACKNQNNAENIPLFLLVVVLFGNDCNSVLLKMCIAELPKITLSCQYIFRLLAKTALRGCISPGLISGILL